MGNDDKGERQFPGMVTVPRQLLAEAYRGLKRTYEMPEIRQQIEAALTQPSHVAAMDCPKCKGSGEVLGMTQGRGPDDYGVPLDCGECNGTGAVPSSTERITEVVGADGSGVAAPCAISGCALFRGKASLSAIAANMSKEAEAAALKDFEEYFLKNYHADCILSRPAWHAPKIFRAALYAIEAARRADGTAT